MDDSNNHDDQADELAGRVKFGPAAGNSIPADWVEPLLCRLFTAYPQAFGTQLHELYDERRLGLGLTVTKKRKR